MKKVLVLILGISVLLALNSAQAITAKITLKGYGPRMVNLSPSDPIDRTSSGLANVGKGSKVYLMANEGDTTTITTYAWSLSGLPPGSIATLSSTNAQDPYFVTDTTGTFTVTLTVTGPSGTDQDTLKINSGYWVGVGTVGGSTPGPYQCALCHEDNEEAWDSTGHAHMFEVEISSDSSYASYCISCHTVGYDANVAATNQGFDDRKTQYGWTFPTTPANPANWTNLVNGYPEVAAVANIQCENCHGPGSRHNGNLSDNRMVSSLEPGACLVCHDAPTHHNFGWQWSVSLHANATQEPSSASCMKCHSTIGFVEWVETGQPASVTNTTKMPITCSACHDPHSAANPNQIRIMSNVTLNDSTTVISTGGKGKLCMNCHKSRRHATLYVAAVVTTPNSHFGPHGSTQADVLQGANVITYGQQYWPSTHAGLEDACVTCHMSTNVADTLVGQHTWTMSHNGVDNVVACVGCHGDLTSFEDIMATADWDGDGTIEPAMVEVDGLIEELGALLPSAGDTMVVDSTWTLTQREAGYDYQVAVQDKSHGAHNVTLIVGILQDAIGEITGIHMVPVTVLPKQFALHPNFPNPFNPATNLRFDVAKPTNVKIKVYNLAGQAVAQLVDKEMAPGTYQVTFNGTNLSSGMYVARLEADGLILNQKMMLIK